MKVYIFGTGQGERYVRRCLREDVVICGYIDNYKADKGLFDGKSVVRQTDVLGEYDYIIISLMDYEGIRDSLLSDGIEMESIISFFDFADASNERYWTILDAFRWRTELIWKHYREIMIPSVDNINYELYADSDDIKRGCPHILDAKSTAHILKNERKSLARFGDGEFEILCGRSRPIFQDVNDGLSKRLKEALNSRETSLLVAIADNYSSLEKYADDAARDIRMYMTKEVRESHMKVLDLNRQYYDTYISRPYIIYRDKEHAKERFDWVKEIWDGQDVLIVEGEYTRFGVGNDLLENAQSVKRILAPSKNAFNKYDEIKHAAREYGKDKLILSILGPTATVLSYDLAKEGYWIIDIGQLDVEYGWFLKKVEKRCGLKYKNVSEVKPCDQLDRDVNDENMQKYFSEIIKNII